ncbi:MAG: phosphate ABC transporter substrate-binding protein [Oligoflexales bacterium]
MSFRSHFLSILTSSLTIFATGAQAETVLKVSGSTTVNPVVVDAADVLKNTKKLKVFVDTQGGSSAGIAYVAEGLSDIGMASREINDHDLQKYPKAKFDTHVIGYDGVALVVSKKLYDEGVKSLTREQIQKLYEGKITNWKEVGGPDRKVAFFNKEPGRGTWEVFANYVYGKADDAPKVFHPEVGANQEARTKVAAHPGGITQLSASWAWDNNDVRALGIKGADGKVIEASLENIERGVYPMRRRLLLVTTDKSKPEAQELISYIMSPDGQKLLTKHGYLPAIKK